MLVSIMGSQGAGKSTVLAELRARGHNTIERKTSRSILSDWNVTLEDVNSDRELTIRFQDEIIRRKWNDEFAASKSGDLWFTERSYTDLFSYSVVALGSNNSFSDWLNEYYRQCARMQQSYSYVFYLQGGLFAVAPDGVRGSNQHYSRLVDAGMWSFAQQMTHHSVLTPISTPDLTTRVDFIENITTLR